MLTLRSESGLLDWFAARGVHVVEGDTGTDWGRYYLGRGTVVLRRGLTAGQRVATLAHEAAHVDRADDGHQSAVVEARINEGVARLLISPAEYVVAERLCGCDVGWIASELGVPAWCVAAYRRLLGRGARLDSGWTSRESKGTWR
ncbi:MAG: hypothetical protein Q3979_05440 [Actinomycetaceae bacterium]|nr:hypothetical protein [Actinomycetaceae bacterium]